MNFIRTGEVSGKTSTSVDEILLLGMTIIELSGVLTETERHVKASMLPITLFIRTVSPI